MARTTTSLEGIVSDIVAREIRAESVPPDVLLYAADATRSASALRGGRVSPERVSRYFSAVVRRRLIRRCGGTSAAARVVAEAVVADLRDSGRDGRDIADLLERDWAERLPGDVIAEWRTRLCA